MNKQKAIIAALGAICVFSFPILSSAATPSIADDAIVMQREAGEGPRGGGNERPDDRFRRGSHGLLLDYGKLERVRTGGEGPRGGDKERAGDRQRRGDKGFIEDGKIELARLAGEGPRGGDNERANDRQRRVASHP